MDRKGSAITVAIVSIVAALVLSPGTLHSIPSGRLQTSAGSQPSVVDSVTAAALPIYAVTFSERGLPSGTEWQVGTANAGESLYNFTTSNASLIQQWLPNGTYHFTANASNDFAAIPGASTFSVQGANITVNVSFAPGALVIFVESGLAKHTVWKLAVINDTAVQNLWSIGSEISAVLPPGSYTFTPYADGYNATPANGTFTLPLTVPGPFMISFGPGPIGYLSGVITVDSAQIWLDGSPIAINAGGGFTWILSPGLHSLIVSADGYNTYVASEHVRAGRTTTIFIELLSSTSLPPVNGPAFTPLLRAIMFGLGAAVVGLGAALVYFIRREGPTPQGNPKA